MADRFPSLEEFDNDAQPLDEVAAEPMADGNDAGADFLAREKALLGEDADLFATSGDLAALAPADADQHDLQIRTAESQFPELGTGGLATSGPSVTYNSGYAATAESEEEPEVVREWRERRDAENARRAEQFAQQREETIREAQQNIDDFYENYNSKKDKLIAQTRREAEELSPGARTLSRAARRGTASPSSST